MTAKEPKAALRTLGWTQADLAREVRTYPTTLSRWTTNNRIPGILAAYIEVLLKIHALSEVINPSAR